MDYNLATLVNIFSRIKNLKRFFAESSIIVSDSPYAYMQVILRCILLVLDLNVLPK